MKHRLKWIKIGIIAGMIALLLWINHAYLHWTPGMIRSWVLSFGWYAPVIFIVIYVLRTIILFPASVLTLAAGLAFGSVIGTLYTVIGATLSAVLAFAISRKLGEGIVQKEWKGKFKKVQQQMEANGFFYMFMLRLIPVLNFDLVSYTAGVSKVRFRAYLWGTFFGIIPATFAYTFLGSSFADGGWREILIACAMFVVICLIPLLFRNKLKTRFNLHAEAEEHPEK